MNKFRPSRVILPPSGALVPNSGRAAGPTGPELRARTHLIPKLSYRSYQRAGTRPTLERLMAFP